MMHFAKNYKTSNPAIDLLQFFANRKKSVEKMIHQMKIGVAERPRSINSYRNGLLSSHLLLQEKLDGGVRSASQDPCPI